MKTHVVVLAIVLALSGCKDQKNEKAGPPPAATPDAGKPKQPPPETDLPVPHVPWPRLAS